MCASDYNDHEIFKLLENSEIYWYYLVKIQYNEQSATKPLIGKAQRLYEYWFSIEGLRYSPTII